MYDNDVHHKQSRKRHKNQLECPNPNLIANLKPFTSCHYIEQRLNSEGKMNFDYMMSEPLGRHMLKSFFASVFSISKVIFMSDVKLFQRIRAESARRKVAEMILERFVLPADDREIEESVFAHDKFYNKFDKSLSLENPRAFYCAEHNNIGYYNKNEIRLIEDNIREGDIPTNIFDKIFKQIKNDIRFDLFPRFLESDFYKNYIRYKSLESQSIGSRDFTRLTAIGYGAYGIVSVAHKRDSGKAYAIKCFNKKQVVANDEARSVLEEKKLLAMMDSRFVTSLRYSYCDKDDICLVLDLMPCGDLKQLLTRHSTFSEELSRFYAAEILLGLEHIHSRGIIYRDIKLENILLDELGHIKISDFGLSVRKKEMKSYAGTPGYTAPEVVRGEYYKKTADFFSFGVIIYRFMSGMRPFGDKSRDLDKNVLNIEPRYSSKFFSPQAISLIKALLEKSPSKRLGSGPDGISEIKEHEWFNPIDFGLLENGYIDPPWKPSKKDFPQKHNRMSINNNRNKYKRIKIPEQFHKKFSGFEYVSKKAIQLEIVEVLECLDRKGNLESETDRREKKNRDCCSVM